MRSKTRRLLGVDGAEAGGAAILFALMLPVLLGFMGLGFDAVRGMLVQQRLQKALDAASLAASSSLGTEAERRTLADNVFAANYGTGLLAPAADFAIAFDDDGEARATASTDMATLFMRLFETDELIVGAASRSQRALIDIEVSLVVDVTSSMDEDAGGGKTRIQALRQAATELVDTLEADRAPGVRLRFALVPYTANVNVGTSSTSFVTGRNHPLFAGTSWAGCVVERRPPYHLGATYDPSATDGSGEWHAYIWPPEPDAGPGCINPGNGGNNGYASVVENPDNGDSGDWAVSRGPNKGCTRQPILPLTGDFDMVRNRIVGLHAHYDNTGTMTATGIAWGLRSLTPGAPFAEGEDWSPLTRKIMIVLTDGIQEAGSYGSCAASTNSGTPYRHDPSAFNQGGDTLTVNGPRAYWNGFGYFEDTDPFGYGAAAPETQLESLFGGACDEVKAAGTGESGIEIYTIGFGTAAAPGGSLEPLLRNCASSAGNYYYAPSTGDLQQAFESIARQLSMVRVNG